MLDTPKDINFIEDERYFSSIIEGLSVESEKIDIFSEKFRKFFEEKNLENTTLAQFIIKIRSFMKEYREDVQKIFSGTILSNYDCLTQCILAGYISEKYGYRLNLARPQEIHRYFHALLIDKNKGKYKMAGKRKVIGYQILETEEAIKQLQLTHPIISLGKKVKSSVRNFL